MKKQMALLLSTALVVSSIWWHGGEVTSAREVKKDISEALQKNDKQEKKEKHLISVANDEIYNYLVEQFAAEEMTELADTANVLSVELTEEASVALAEISEIIVEEEQQAVACEKKGTEAKKDKKENTAEWNMEMIHAASGQQSNGSINVVILDSGIDVSENIDVVEHKNFVEEDEDVFTLYEDITGHGTAVAGIIASREVESGDVVGVNPGVRLYSGRVLDDENTAPLSRVVEGIYWAIEKDADILCLCLGLEEESEILKQAVCEAKNAGMLIVAAAGNEEQVVYPAAYDEVMAVSGVDAEGNLSEYSASSEAVDIAAPGEHIRSVASFGMDIVASGTSMAVPHVVGAASVIWEKDAERSADFVRGLLEVSANQSMDSIGDTYGILDLEYALEYYDEYAQSYTENEEEIPANYSVLENETDVEYVDGMWAPAKHAEIVGELDSYLSNSNQVTLLKNAAKFSDQSLKTLYVFHGIFNYVAALEYIYGYAYWLKEGKTLDQAKELMKNSYYVSNSSNKKSDLDSGIEKCYKATIEGQENVTNVNNRNSLKVLGLAVHLSGDIYAHRTIIPKDFFKNSSYSESQKLIEEVADEFVDYSAFQKYVNNYYMETRSIKQAKIDETANSPIDRIDFLPSRYKVASVKTVEAILCCRTERTPEFDVMLWFANVYKDGGYKRKMAKLLEYTSEVADKKNIAIDTYCGYTEKQLASYTVDSPVSNDSVYAYFH